MKEVNPKMTKEKLQESKSYIKYIYDNTGIKFTCKSLRDYYFIKTLYLLLVGYEDVEDDFYIPLAKHYGNDEKIYDKVNKDYFGYDLHNILYNYIVKYYYSDLSNFAVVWEYYENISNPEDEIKERFRILEKNIDKNNKKIVKLLDNIGTLEIRKIRIEEVKQLQEETDEDYALIWRTHKDDRRCEICKSLEGKQYEEYDRLPYTHPNCRCWLQVVEVDD